MSENQVSGSNKNKTMGSVFDERCICRRVTQWLSFIHSIFVYATVYTRNSPCGRVRIGLI